MEEDKSIGSYVARLFNQSHSYMKKELKPYNLGPMQLRIIQVLSGDDNIKQQELADRLNVDKTSLARTIRKLEENGYILRLKNESDTRAYRISLTGKAKAIEEEIYPVLSGWTEALLEGFSGEERDQFFAYLERALSNAIKKTTL